MVFVCCVPEAPYRTTYLVFARTCRPSFGLPGLGRSTCCSVVSPSEFFFWTVVTRWFRCRRPSPANPGTFLEYVSVVLLFPPALVSVSSPTLRENSESLPSKSGRETRSSVVRFLPSSWIVFSFTSPTFQLPLPSGSSVVFFSSSLWSALRFCNSCVCREVVKPPLPSARYTVVFVSCTSGLVFLVSAV